MRFSSKNYYKTLEVDPEASAEVIEAAYRRLARRYHPDLNNSQDAKDMMQELNEAHRVLRDPQQRMIYDIHLHDLAHSPAQQTAAFTASAAQGHFRRRDERSAAGSANRRNPYGDPSSVMAAACQKCGRSDASLRFAQFPYVISLLFVSLRRGEGGLFCSKCRHREMAVARLTTLLLGWWGIPWGPFYSLNALFTPSDGVMDAKFNAGYLRWLSGYLLQLGDRHEAKKAVQASLRLRYDAEFAAAAQAVFGAEVSAEHIYQQEHRRRIVWYVIATVVILAAIILAAFFGSWVMGQKPLGGFGGFGPTATMPSTPSTMPSAAGATATGATMTMAARVASPTAAADAADLSWSHFASANGEVALDYPSDWVVEKETSGEVQLIGLRNGVTLFWRPAVHESYPDGYINHLIAQSEGNANSAQNYGDRLRDYLNDVFGQANIAAVADLKIKQIGPYHTIFNSVITQGGDGEGAGRALHLLLYFFDCGANTCQLTAYVDGNKPLSMADFGVIERVIRSIQMDPAAHNSSDSSD